MDPLFICFISLVSLLPQCHGQDWYKNALKEYPGLADVIGPPKVHLRVIGGEATTIEKLGGYLISLRYMGDFICGGTLIEARIVVSAAHCFKGRSIIAEWVAVGGVTSLDEEGTRSKVQDIVSPAVFTERNMHMDVAVLLLETPLEAPNIHTIPLCNSSLDAGRLLSVSGWGLTDPKAASPHQSIRTVLVPIVKKSECKKTYKKSMVITESMFCAGALGAKDACTFDSGGPFVYKRKDGVTELCGIVSFGISCASPKYAGVYTDVNYVKPFIEKTVAAFRSIM
ncbi:seminase [Drosophila albomicans]|uniref:Seminase n=1 Tax=Drosophila albomicans TaxID=7291 RepID=A0A6P8X0H9_DROAB|nr:seminase [Drosophila albomicans]